MLIKTDSSKEDMLDAGEQEPMGASVAPSLAASLVSNSTSTNMDIVAEIRELAIFWTPVRKFVSGKL